MLKGLKRLGVLAVALSFLLCAPSITLGDTLETDFPQSSEFAGPSGEAGEGSSTESNTPVVNEPVGDSTDELADGAGEDPAGETITEPTDEPANESAEEPAGEPITEPTDEPVNESTEEPAEGPIATNEPEEEPANEPIDDPAGEPTGEPADEPADEPIEEPMDEAVKEPAEEPAEEPVEEPAEEMVEEQPAEEQKEELAEEQIILASVEGIPLEAKVDFILDNRIIGSVLNGVVVDAVPVPSKDRNRIRAYVANRVKITGAKIHFELLNKEPAEQPVEQPAEPRK